MTGDAFALLRPLRVGLMLSLLATLFGFGMGGAFGLMEDKLKGGLKESADNAPAEVYQGDAAKKKAVTDKAWAYYKRAHLHGGAIGANAMILCLLMGFLDRTPARLRSATGVALGGGAWGYAVFWLLAGMRAPGLGSTDAAKESLTWLGGPTSAAILIGAVAVLAMLVVQWKPASGTSRAASHTSPGKS